MKFTEVRAGVSDAKEEQPLTDEQIVGELLTDPINGQLLASRFRALRSWGMSANEALNHWRMGVRIVNKAR
jgi:hypothetical protein